MTGTRTLLGVGLAALTLVVAGCTGDPEPIFSPTPSVSTPPTASPTPTETTEPWEEHTKAGAEAFAAHWLEAFYDAQSTGDTTGLRALGPDCELCDSFADQIDEVYDAGGSIVSDPFEVTETTFQQRKLGPHPSVLLVYSHNGVTWIREEGGAPEKFEPGTVDRVLSLTWLDPTWSVIGLIDIPDDL